MYDTCQDKITVYKQALMAAVDSECAAEYDLGILIPESFKLTLEPFKDYSLVSISTYKPVNITNSLIDIVVHFLTTKYEVVDLFLSSSEDSLQHFLKASKDKGLCVKSYSGFSELSNKTDTVIVATGSKEDIRSWIEESDEDEGFQRTWIILPTDDSIFDGYYISNEYKLTITFSV